jgi:4-diphosphocytidyl-2-C-methyl-D-erythritol kinase
MDEHWSAWPAPAKLNLFLHIVGRRADGYHQLQTVYQLLDWGDRVRLKPRRDGVILRRSGLASVSPEQDLAVRAARALREHAGDAGLGVEIAVDKRIPVGAGLGGGSSDAATVLVALNELWALGFGTDQLAAIGLALGADVPVFVRGSSAWAEGIGEELTPLRLPLRGYVLVDPRVAVVTAELFQDAELTRNSAPMTIARFRDGAPTENAFAPIVRRRFPQVAAALDWLGQYGEARLSGTGGCVFAALDEATAARALRECPPQFVAWRAAGVNQSPLHAALRRRRARGLHRAR